MSAGGKTSIYKAYGSKSELTRASGEWKLTARPGGWVLAERSLKDGKTERVRLLAHEAKGKLGALVGGHLWFGDVQESRAGATTAGSDADLIAQFPGKVRKILVAAGTKVEEGAPLVLVEAMKMEFAIKAPFAGTIAKINVQEGQQLSPGTKFVDLTPSETKKS